MSNVKARIKSIVPNPHSKFPKLQGGDPYYFLDWKKGYFRYWFWNSGKTYENIKRVPLAELEAAARECLARGIFDRDTFRTHCPVSASDGPCGFAVIGRCLEFLGIAKYAGRGKGFRH